MMKYFVFISVYLLLSCEASHPKDVSIIALLEETKPVSSTSIVVLGTVQDAGSPQIGCVKSCCKDLPDHLPERKVVSLGIIDPENKKQYMIEASPDFVSQVELLNRHSGIDLATMPDGVFLTHAHIGHYTGLMYLGKEAINASEVPVHAMPRMQSFLETNGPWSQLVKNKNISLAGLSDAEPVVLSSNITVTPLMVPHRDEFSETAGFLIAGPNKSALFIPDIDKWSKWKKDIVEMIQSVDYALVDATFYDAEEINNRDISEIPHPFVIESMALFDNLTIEEKSKIYFTHFNHTNPLLDQKREQYKLVKDKGYNIAAVGDVLIL